MVPGTPLRAYGTSPSNFTAAAQFAPVVGDPPLVMRAPKPACVDAKYASNCKVQTPIAVFVKVVYAWALVVSALRSFIHSAWVLLPGTPATTLTEETKAAFESFQGDGKV